MTSEEIEALFRDPESDRVERKASISDPEKIRQALCAFANDLPNHQRAGVLFVGVNDDGSCANLPISEQVLQSLAAMRSDGNIIPLPSLTVIKRTIGGCEVAVVLVEPADAPPVRLRGRVWIRVGPRRALATPDEERRLAERRRARDLPFDVQPLVSSRIEDLDVDSFRREYLPAAVSRDVLEANQRSTDDQLASLRFTTTEGIPTTLGMLLAGKDPRRFIAGDYVQFLRIDGTGLADAIKDQKEIDGPMPELLRNLEEVLRLNVTVAADLRGMTDVQLPDYPLAALQQLVRNALLHRNYETTNAPTRVTWFNDRIEILNPGGPFGQVTRENFGTPGVTDYRNPHLAEALKVLGYVQRFGVGIELAKSALARNGNPELKFQVEATHVLATVRKRP